MLDAVTATQLAMDFDQLKLQTISHNIANTSTPGYKKQIVDQLEFDQFLTGNVQSAQQQLLSSQKNTQGSFNQTHNDKDLAISGDGYFQVQNEQGVYYTRRGDFKINQRGELTTATGETLIGDGGVIQIDDHSFSVDTSGSVSIDKRKVAQIPIVRFQEANSLRYVGNGLYQTDESPIPINGKTRLLQGFLEQANVKSVDEMMDMMAMSRHFEASQRIMRTADNLLSTAINQLGEGNV